MYESYDPNATTPPVSGINAPGNTLTAAGPATEPTNTGAAPTTSMDPRKMQMVMALMAQQMGKMGGGAQPAQLTPRQQFDIYGRPI